MSTSNLTSEKAIINPYSSSCTIMVVETSDYLHRLEANQFNLFTQKLRNGLYNSINKFNGDIIKHNDNSYLIRFEFATDAILCALKIKSNFKYITPKFDTSIRQLKIGIAATENKILNNTVLSAIRICEVLKNQITITSHVKTLFYKENKNAIIDKALIRILKPDEEKFLAALMNVIETNWNNIDFSSGTLNDYLNYNASQIYRKMTSLTGKSPTIFIRDFRLNKALSLTHEKTMSISNTALKSGFKSPTYFTRCFKKKFNILPTKYIQQHT